MNYHDFLIELIIKNKQEVDWIVNMYNTNYKDNISLSKYGDLDILIEGTDISTQKPIIAIIEVKGHKGLVSHYIKKQLPKYISSFPQAKQFVAYGTSENSKNFKDIIFEKLK